MFSRAAFENGRTSGSPLLSLYCSLVVIELALKDSLTPWRTGHTVQQWLTELNDAGLAALTYQLANQMQTLTCTDRLGQESVVDINHYPDLRYLQHEIDYPGKTTDASIARALQILGDIWTVLQAKGVL